MEYSKSLRSVGYSNLFISIAILTSIFLIDNFFEVQLEKNRIAIFFGYVAKLICTVVSIAVLLRGIILIIVGGNWKIEVNGDYITWQVPSKSNFLGFKSDDSFRLNVREINYVVSDQGTGDFGGTSLIFVTSSGDKYTVSGESGINLNRVTQKLEKIGLNVRYETSN